ncbi:MAG: hypothetical protein HN686_15995, partial [Bacteroidetes bacterium]|nr:hypothetical protein [Bacteroidota bacterium]
MKNRLSLKAVLCPIFVVILTAMSLGLSAQNPVSYQLRDIDQILSEQKRAEVVNDLLQWRLDHIIPDLMQRENIDMWLVMCRETNEDPVF